MSKDIKYSKKLPTFIVFIIIVFIGSFAKTAVDWIFNYKKNNDINTTIKDVIHDINLKLPSMVDEYTRINHISLNGNNIIQNYTIMDKLTNEDKIQLRNIIKSFKEHSIRQTCSNEKTRMILNHNFILNNVYYDLEDTKLFEVHISKNDCNKLK